MKEVVRRARVALLALFVFVAAQILRLNKARRGHRIIASPRVLLIGAYGNGNYGDDVIGQAIVDGIKSQHGSVLIAARLDDTSRLGANVAETVVVGGGVRSLIRTWRQSKSTDLAILGGGGLLEGRPNDVNVHRLILEYLGKLAVCGLTGQRMVIHGIGVSPRLYSSSVVNAAARAMLRAVDVIAVRDPASFTTVLEAGGNVALIRDPAIVLFQRWAPQIRKEVGTVGVVVLDHHRWPTFGVACHDLEQARAADLGQLADDLVNRSQQGRQIKLFAFHWSDVNICQDLLQEFLDRGGVKANIGLEPYIQETSDRPFKLLMGCETVLTMRFHPALAALTASARVEVIGTLQKLEQLRRTSSSVNGNWTYPVEYRDPLEQLGFAIRGSKTTLGRIAKSPSTDRP